MGNSVSKEDHNGAKNGGGHWGKRAEAKSQSKKLRRRKNKQLVKICEINIDPVDSERPKSIETYG